jgi:hypothetical protein
MERLFELIGLALPDTPTILRLKVLVVGVGGVIAGVLFALSGVDGAIAGGALMVACGITLLAISVRSLLGDAWKRKASRIKEQRQRDLEARHEAERLARQASCEHHWAVDDAGLEVGNYRDVCVHCGAHKQALRTTPG